MKTTDFLPFVDKFILLSVNSYWKLRLIGAMWKYSIDKKT